jgi:hypothetical protein
VPSTFSHPLFTSAVGSRFLAFALYGRECAAHPKLFSRASDRGCASDDGHACRMYPMPRCHTYQCLDDGFDNNLWWAMPDALDPRFKPVGIVVVSTAWVDLENTDVNSRSYMTVAQIIQAMHAKGDLIRRGASSALVTPRSCQISNPQVRTIASHSRRSSQTGARRGRSRRITRFFGRQIKTSSRPEFWP